MSVFKIAQFLLEWMLTAELVLTYMRIPLEIDFSSHADLCVAKEKLLLCKRVNAKVGLV